MRYAIPLLLAGGCLAWGQSPAFEVASIKKATAQTGPFANATGCSSTPPLSETGVYTCYNATVALLAFQAYGLKQYQMSGVNDDKDKYTVRAKIPQGASQDEIKLMLQNLLAERFKLTFHWEAKEVQGYDLVVAKNGLKIKETPEPPTPAASPGTPGKVEKDADGFAIYPATASFSLPRANGLIRMRATAVPMDRLATNLTSLLQKPVFDATGLKGKYGFIATFTQDSVGQASPDSEPVAGFTIFEALEKDLGLRLEKTKKSIDIFVIDHVDKAAAEN
jgi:uncharacterized protein (TIGR03435 family)